MGAKIDKKLEKQIFKVLFLILFTNDIIANSGYKVNCKIQPYLCY